MPFFMRALSTRPPPPYAELILRGVKTIEYRSRPTRIIGERFSWFFLFPDSCFSNGLSGDGLP